MFRILSELPHYLETFKNLEFEIFDLNLKKPEFFNNFIMVSIIFRFDKKKSIL